MDKSQLPMLDDCDQVEFMIESLAFQTILPQGKLRIGLFGNVIFEDNFQRVQLIAPYEQQLTYWFTKRVLGFFGKQYPCELVGLRCIGYRIADAPVCANLLAIRLRDLDSIFYPLKEVQSLPEHVRKTLIEPDCVYRDTVNGIYEQPLH